jgi:hypothetical protein
MNSHLHKQGEIMTLQKNHIPVRLFANAMRFASWLQNLPNQLTPPPFRLVQISASYWQSRVLYVAAKLDIATVLADGQLSAEELAARVHAQPDAVFRLLRMLAAMGIFEEVSPQVFRNNKLSNCLRESYLQSVRAMILMHNSPELSQPWFEKLEQGVREGNVPFSLTHGQDLWAYLNTHPEFDKLFGRAMDSVEALVGESFATDFDWSRFVRLIDVGGSNGCKSVAILKRHPRLKALVADREQVIRGAAEFWQQREERTLLPRMSFEACDLLQSAPKAASDKDIYLLSAVLHGLGDDDCITVLRNLANASAGTGATIAVMEMVMPDMQADLPTASFDMQMFATTHGRERTLGEWQRLFERSGLKLQEVVGLQSFGKILVVRAG